MNAQQLKNAILQEAIEGRLVPQDPNDEPASALLERIRKEKEELVKAGKLKKKDLEVKPISEDEIPFEIPEGWEWVRWGELGEYKKGPFGSSLTKSMFVPQSDEAVKVYEQKNAIQKNYSLGDYYITKEKYETMAGFTVRPGDIIVSCAGTIGETYLLPPEAPVGIINQALMRAKLYMDSIIPYWLLHFQYVLLIENKLKGSGSAIKNIPPFEVLKAMPVPLPPLAEQHRIVAKIEELLPKVEEYGKAQDALNKLNAELPERLKKSILQEAISGRLVPQDPNDEPASVLLAKIRKEKEQLIREKKLILGKPEKKVHQNEEEDLIIPHNWAWCQINDICRTFGRIGFRGYTKEDLRDSPQDGAITLSPSNIVNGKLNLSSCTYLSWEKYEESPEIQVEEGDIILVKTASIGKCALINEVKHKMTVNPQFVVLKDIKIYNVFLYYLLLSPYVQNKIYNYAIGTSIPTYSQVSLISMKIPLPPLAEQHRIVKKLEQLLGEIDKLKK